MGATPLGSFYAAASPSPSSTAVSPRESITRGRLATTRSSPSTARDTSSLVTCCDTSGSKPQISHIFEARFRAKYFVAENADQLRRAFATASESGIEFLLMELIPGPDDRLCSYYTYLDEDGEPLFHFTKRVIRRYPVHMGLGCYHVTDHIPELHDLGLRLFRQVKLRGLANVEFKLDERDGQFKIIECNPRFTNATNLVARAGFDLPRFIYNRLVGLPQKPLVRYRTGMRLWYPAQDFRAFRELRRRGEMTAFQWLRSIFHRQCFPVFAGTDPWPSVVHYARAFRRRLERLWPTRFAHKPLVVPATVPCKENAHSLKG